MSKKDAFERIRDLNIPGKAKDALRKLWKHNRNLVISILQFIKNHRDFFESLILGAIVAVLLGQIPWVGTFLAFLALAAAGVIGMLRELRNAFETTVTTA